MMRLTDIPEIDSAETLVEVVHEIGFLPLLESGIKGYSAEDMVSDDCRYHTFDGGGWEWQLWEWKGPIIQSSDLVYGKFFNSKACFVSPEWWSRLCCYRRNVNPYPAEGTIEETILDTLSILGNSITRELRAACGFGGQKLRSQFDGYVTRLQMACRVVTEDFVYPTDRHGKQYGWGWALLTTPEQLYGREITQCDLDPQEAYHAIAEHLHILLPNATAKQIDRLIK